ncbi:putative bifunctional diguanylate cyclase/phosphodiesterase [Sphingomonas sp. RS6]
MVTRAEAAIVTVGGVLFASWASIVHPFETVVAFLMSFGKWPVDEIFFTFSLSAFALFAIALRRAGELAGEMANREAAEARALSLARHDPLTGLANRRVLQDSLPTLVAAAEAAARQCTLLCIDLDHFKPINDVYGHETGDRVLGEVATRLSQIAKGELVARTGGDEFVMAVLQEHGSDAAARLAGRVIQSLSAPYRIGDRRLEIGASVGIARSPLDASSAEDLLRAADVAMYESKRSGRGTYHFFRSDMDERLRTRAAIEADLRDAIENGEIVPYFQPVISLADDRVLGFEALARWHHPVRGTIAPDTFIPVAEDLGLIDMLSVRILRDGCIAAREWAPDATLSINISPVQLRDPWLAVRLLAVLTDTGFPPGRLIIEVTENAIIDDIPAVAELFESLRRTGIRIALDDFGKGYSSLSHLRLLHFDHLKIDGSFVRTVASPESQKIVKAVAGLGKALGMPVTAEGVETAAAAELLRSLGCEQAQGYFYGTPAPAGALGVAADGESRFEKGVATGN